MMASLHAKKQTQAFPEMTAARYDSNPFLPTGNLHGNFSKHLNMITTLNMHSGLLTFQDFQQYLKISYRIYTYIYYIFYMIT
jgi:hypothetical protein